MKATYLSLILTFATLALLPSCGPDTIKQKQKVDVTSVTLSLTTASLQQGETLQLTATVKPADAEAKISFTSDNASVASVSETGLVKALSAGTATITAQAGDKKATCVVTVAKATNVILVNKDDGKKYPAGSTVEYVAKVSKEKAESCEIPLFFSVLETTDYDFLFTFDKAVSGSICLGSCIAVKDETSYDGFIKLAADDEEIPYQKEKGEMTPLGIHIDVSASTGGVYKNRIVVKLTPKDGGESLQWTVNLAITVK